VQRTVQPGVVVVALGSAVVAGTVPGSLVPAAIWTVGDEGVKTAGRPPGAPSPRLLKEAERRLRAGEPAPTIGHVDIAERTMMAGRPRQRRLAISGGSVLLLVILGYFLLPVVLRALPFWRPAQTSPICPQGCILVDAQAIPGGTQLIRVRAGKQFGLFFKAATACPNPSNSSVLSADACTSTSGQLSGAVGTYTARAAGSADMVVNASGASLTVHIDVQ
jgi:hypothetical protein